MQKQLIKDAEKRSSSASRLSRIFGNAFTRASKRQSSATRAQEAHERDFIGAVIGANLNGTQAHNDDSLNNNSSKQSIVSEDVSRLQEFAKACARLPLVEWRLTHIDAFVTVQLDLPPRHRRLFVDNVKSGHVLVQLTDNELQHTLQLSHPMLLRKVRAAIDEYKMPPHKRSYLKIADCTAAYVRDVFLPFCGLASYASAFYAVRADGRVLNTLTRKQLEKHFNMNRKIHQSSLLKGVELLRRFKYDVKVS